MFVVVTRSEFHKLADKDLWEGEGVVDGAAATAMLNITLKHAWVADVKPDNGVVRRECHAVLWFTYICTCVTCDLISQVTCVTCDLVSQVTCDLVSRVTCVTCSLVSRVTCVTCGLVSQAYNGVM